MISMAVLAGFFGLTAGEEGDEALLAMLEVGGSDLSQPHEIEFFLYFPFQLAARCAARILERAGFKIEVTHEEEWAWHKWFCLATKTMVPEASALKRIRRRLSAIAALGLGKYDGWQTAPVK